MCTLFESYRQGLSLWTEVMSRRQIGRWTDLEQFNTGNIENMNSCKYLCRFCHSLHIQPNSDGFHQKCGVKLIIWVGRTWFISHHIILTETCKKLTCTVHSIASKASIAHTVVTAICVGTISIFITLCTTWLTFINIYNSRIC